MFEGWGEYYLLVGTAAAALIGLLFVVMSLLAGRDRAQIEAGSRFYMTPIVFDLGAIVVLSGAALAPIALEAIGWLTVAVGRAPNEVVRATTGALVGITGRDPVVVPTDDHDVHLNDPATLAAAIASAR